MDIPCRDDWRVTFDPVSDLPGLRETWLGLQEQALHSYFQSWGWVACWLQVLPSDVMPRLLRVVKGVDTVGLALLVQKRNTRHHFFVSNGIYLFETGDPEMDALTIEHNGLLAKRGLENEVVSRGLEFLITHVDGWDEFFVSGVEGSSKIPYVAASEGHRLDVRVLADKPYLYVDLCRLRGTKNQYLETISSNTRYQIRRALRGYEGRGEVTISVAQTPNQALRYFDSLRQLHQSYWTNKGHPGAFSSSLSENFHRCLITTRFSHREIQLMEIKAGTELIGYLYNFTKDGRVYAYQSGFEYGLDGKLKPGLVSHYLAVGYNADAGADVYDFLAGDAQYKRSLATDTGEMIWLAVQKRKQKFLIERILKSLYRRLVRQ